MTAFSVIMRVSLAILALVAISNSGVKAKPPSKIVGGRRVPITDAPYMVMIRNSLRKASPKGLICGGTLITERHIVTAAHCFHREPTDPSDSRHISWLRVMAGKDFYDSETSTYEIEKVYCHPNYTGYGSDDVNERADIAVIELKTEIPRYAIERSIDLVDAEPPTGSPGLILGWGDTDPLTKSVSEYLQGSRGVTVGDHRFCNLIAPDIPFAKDDLCIITSKGAGPCYGDSGGPLIVDGALAGVITCVMDCTGEYPSCIANVAYHKPWIEDAVKGIAESLIYSANSVVSNIHEGL